MVILVTILLIAIPSITSSLSRSEDKQLEAQKAAIVSDTIINMKGKDFADYSAFRNGSCVLSVESLYNKGYITEKTAKDEDDNFIDGCVGYVDEELQFLDSCGSECVLN